VRTERGALGCMSYLTSRVVSSGRKVTWRNCCNVLPDFKLESISSCRTNRRLPS